MFFPEKIKSIKPSDHVLEIGPGSSPHPRADVFLEKKYETDEEKFIQSGFVKPAELTKRTYFYEGSMFPFKNKEFDYVICSHVIEHVPKTKLSSFIAEIERISDAGYIEFPTIFYELINYQPVHIWFMSFRDDTILFLDKSVFESNFIHKIYREMFYGKDDYLSKVFNRYKDLFFVGFEWKKAIKYRTVTTFDELINEDDFAFFSEYFKFFQTE